MKKLVTLLLVFIVLLQSSTKMAIVAYYQINKDFISSTLCENKAKPMMHCDGKCYLKKKIKAQESNESKLPGFLKQMPEVSLFMSLFELSLPTPKWQLVAMVFANHYSFTYFSTSQGSIFQPPKEFIS